MGMPLTCGSRRSASVRNADIRPCCRPIKSHLLTAITSARPSRSIRSAMRRSCSSNLFCASITSTTTSAKRTARSRSEEHTSELQSPDHLVCRLLLEKKNTKQLVDRAQVFDVARDQSFGGPRSTVEHESSSRASGSKLTAALIAGTVREGAGGGCQLE